MTDRALSALETQNWRQLKVIIIPSPMGTDRVQISAQAIRQVGRRQHIVTLWQGHADYNHELGSVSECLGTVIQALTEAQARL